MLSSEQRIALLNDNSLYLSIQKVLSNQMVLFKNRQSPDRKYSQKDYPLRKKTYVGIHFP